MGKTKEAAFRSLFLFGGVGLDGDWGCNSMVIWENGKFEEYNCHGASVWAEPIMIVNYKDAPSETYSVWKERKL